MNEATPADELVRPVVYRLRPKIGLIALTSLALLVLPLLFGAGRLNFPWPYVAVVPLCVWLIVRGLRRRVEITEQTLKYVGTTGLSNREIDWKTVSSAKVTIRATRSSDFERLVLLVALRVFSLFFRDREHMVLEIETTEFELLRLSSADTAQFARMVGDISRFCEVDTREIAGPGDGENTDARRVQ